MSPDNNVKSAKPKAIALLSGGLDSTVSLVQGLEHYDIVTALTFNYGQRACGKEMKAAKRISEHYRIPHKVIALPWLADLLPDALAPRPVGEESPVHTPWVEEGEAKSEAFFEAQPVWVPNRNGLFINIAAVYAEALGASAILFGANAEEAEAFPDNTEVFRDKINDCLTFSTLSHPVVTCPVGHLSKPEIVDLGLKLNVPLQLVWSCYGDGSSQCGLCPSCFRLKNALERTTGGAPIKRQLAFSH